MSPWQLQASLVLTNNSDPDAYLMGTTAVRFSQGWANFSNLAVSHNGTYNLRFDIVQPVAASHFSLEEGSVTLTTRDMSGRVAVYPNDTLVDVPFEISVEFIDVESGLSVDDVDWKVSNISSFVFMFASD